MVLSLSSLSKQHACYVSDTLLSALCFISSTPNSPDRLALIFPFNKARGGSFALHLGIGRAGFQTCFCLKTELEKLSGVTSEKIRLSLRQRLPLTEMAETEQKPGSGQPVPSLQNEGRMMISSYLERTQFKPKIEPG